MSMSCIFFGQFSKISSSGDLNCIWQLNNVSVYDLLKVDFIVRELHFKMSP